MTARTFGLLALLLAAGCTRSGSETASDNPIDLALAPRFAEEGITPEAAGRAELCRRAFADLAGRYPSESEVNADCDRPLDALVRDLQRRPEYQRVAAREWRDRFATSDVLVDWRYLKGLFGLVEKLHADKLSYRDFAVKAMAHPGLVLNNYQISLRVDAMFVAFAGRHATQAEKDGFGALYRPWVGLDVQEPDFPYLEEREGAGVAPYLCYGDGCTTSLYGGATLDFSSWGDDEEYRWEDLSSSQREMMETPGRLLSSQLFFWEAEADAILNRLLGWSDGGRTPREPGIVLPEVREIVADHLRRTGSVTSAERLVMTSWLYRMKTQVPDDGYGDDPLAPMPAIYAAGPVKAAHAEVWLDSMESLAGELGACDPRYPDMNTYFEILDAAEGGGISEAQAATDVRKLWEMQESWLPWDDEYDFPDMSYLETAQVIGGCPGLFSTRREPTGLSFAFVQDSVAETLCASSAGDADGAGAMLDEQMRAFLGRAATDGERGDYDAAAAACAGAECEPDAMRDAVCVGLAGSAEALFY